MADIKKTLQNKKETYKKKTTKCYYGLNVQNNYTKLSIMIVIELHTY